MVHLIVVSLPDPSIAMTQPYRSKRNAVVDYCQQKYSLWYHQPSPNCKPSLFMIITYITILFRVKNSTAFATDDEFDCNKRWIVRSWCAWWRDWYENGVIEPWDGAHQRAEEVDVCENREKWDSLNRFVCVASCARPTHTKWAQWAILRCRGKW